MNESTPPSPPVVVVRRKGLGCAPTGCIVLVIVLMLLGVGVGAMLWLFSQGGQAFVQDKPAAIRAVDASDAQYQATLDKLAPFAQALKESRAATVELTLEEFNVLAARSPQFQFLRGKVYLEAAEKGHLGADLSTRIGYEGAQARYFNGRAVFDASYASNGFVLFLRQLAPLKEESNTPFQRFINRRSTLTALSQEVGRSVNDDLRRQARKDPFVADLLRKLRTVVFRDGKIVATTGDAEPSAPPPTPVSGENPTPSPVATTPDPA